MRRARVTGQAAVNRAVLDLMDKFEYPDELGLGGDPIGGGGGGMAHVLIVSTSELPDVQAKADYVVAQSNSATQLQSVFDEINTDMNGGPYSIWMAGVFDLDQDVDAPVGAWIRGLGYRGGGET